VTRRVTVDSQLSKMSATLARRDGKASSGICSKNREICRAAGSANWDIFVCIVLNVNNIVGFGLNRRGWSKSAVRGKLCARLAVRHVCPVQWRV